MEISVVDLQKTFNASNEKVECYISISTKTNKKNKAVLALTLSYGNPMSINIYIVNSMDKNDIKRKLISNAKNLTEVDCHDNPDQPCYDIEFKCSDGKTKRIFANLIEDKHRFIERLMRVMYIHNMGLFKTIQFRNLPISINLEDICSEGKLNTKYYDAEKLENDPGSVDIADFSRYQNLSDAEEVNMQKFLDESSEAVINAIEFQETLKQHLLAMEGTNVHSIMSSENQMLKLMEYLDQAIEQVELLESKIDMQDKFLAEVEDSMSCIRDRDELMRLTAHNRDQLQFVLERLLCQITFDGRHLTALQNLDISKVDSVNAAREATSILHSLLETPINEGLENMKAVRDKTAELNAAADEFSRRFSLQFNNAMTRQVNKLMSISTSNLEKVLELHRSSRRELLPSADFMTWLKFNRTQSYVELQKLYMNKMASVYDHEFGSMIELIKGKLTAKDKNVSSSATKLGSTSNLKISDKLRTKLTSESSTNLHHDSASRMSGSGIVDIVFEDFLSKLKLIVLEEEEFMTRMFRLDCRRITERNDAVSNKVPANEPHVYLTSASYHVFAKLKDYLNTLIQVLEQHDSNQSLLMVVVVNRQFDESVLSSEFLKLSWSVLFLHTKRSFNAYIDRLILSFREQKAPRRSRCGILPFVNMYSSFAEQTLQAFQDSSRQNDLIIAHQKIVQDLIVQIERIASESVKTPKEVIIMENFHCMMDILRRLRMPELDELQMELKRKYNESLNNYVNACVGRPFDKLYTFFENVIMAIDSGIKSTDIGYQFAYSKSELNKVIREYPGKEVKKGLEQLCKKVEKYVSEDSSLLQVIWLSIQKQFITECQRYENLIEECYPNSKISLEFSTTELEQYFREIASSH